MCKIICALVFHSSLQNKHWWNKYLADPPTPHHAFCWASKLAFFWTGCLPVSPSHKPSIWGLQKCITMSCESSLTAMVMWTTWIIFTVWLFNHGATSYSCPCPLSVYYYVFRIGIHWVKRTMNLSYHPFWSSPWTISSKTIRVFLFPHPISKHSSRLITVLARDPCDWHELQPYSIAFSSLLISFSTFHNLPNLWYDFMHEEEMAKTSTPVRRRRRVRQRPSPRRLTSLSNTLAWYKQKLSRNRVELHFLQKVWQICKRGHITRRQMTSAVCRESVLVLTINYCVDLKVFESFNGVWLIPDASSYDTITEDEVHAFLENRQLEYEVMTLGKLDKIVERDCVWKWITPTPPLGW